MKELNNKSLNAAERNRKFYEREETYHERKTERIFKTIQKMD